MDIYIHRIESIPEWIQETLSFIVMVLVTKRKSKEGIEIEFLCYKQNQILQRNNNQHFASLSMRALY